MKKKTCSKTLIQSPIYPSSHFKLKNLKIHLHCTTKSNDLHMTKHNHYTVDDNYI